ncbi:MAG: pyridoxine 5'-phosphate synthase, partial [Ignavibacteria bacterium GWA2_35_8]
EARGGKEPDPVATAILAELAGASGIVCHLREDRRHINDRDVKILREVVQSKLDLEMAAHEEIINIALNLKPDLVTIVPEGRMELTTEGGLDVAGNPDKFESLVERMHGNGIEVSFFVEPDKKQIEASLLAGADMVELHTGNYANAKGELFNDELEKIKIASFFANETRLKIAAGHGINYLNIKPLCLIPEIGEFSIGHSIISRAIHVGIERATREMIEVINTSTLHRSLNR